MKLLGSIRPLITIHHQLIRRYLGNKLLLFGYKMNLWCLVWTTNKRWRLAVICEWKLGVITAHVVTIKTHAGHSHTKRRRLRLMLILHICTLCKTLEIVLNWSVRWEILLNITILLLHIGPASIGKLWITSWIAPVLTIAIIKTTQTTSVSMHWVNWWNHDTIWITAFSFLVLLRGALSSLIK